MTNNDIIKLCKQHGLFKVQEFTAGARVGKESVFDYADVDIVHELRVLVHHAIKQQKRKDLIKRLMNEDIEPMLK